MSEEMYEEDFDVEEIIEDDEEFLKRLGFIHDEDENEVKKDSDHNLITPPTSRMTIESKSPESDSAGNKVNSKHDFETMTSFDDYEDFEEDESCLSYDFQLFRASLSQLPCISKQKRYKNGTRTSLTFSNQRMEEIQRENRHLLEKIMRNGPSGDGFSKKQASRKANNHSLRSSAEVNRRKKQAQIEYENQILKRKLEKIASRRS